MEILCIIPPYVPSYFNAGHHLPIFQVGAYLRENIANCNVTCIDAGVLNYSWRDICAILIRQYDLIVVLNDFDTIDNLRRFLKYVKELSPKSKTLTCGRLSAKVPSFFKRIGFDAILISGDYELGVHSYILYLRHEIEKPVGVLLKAENYLQYGEEKVLDPERWVFPDINEIPYDHHRRMYTNDKSDSWFNLFDYRIIVFIWESNVR
jgi:anaerobic magnesium-protoporphyrin IX monomethyl ester cyclase